MSENKKNQIKKKWHTYNRDKNQKIIIYIKLWLTNWAFVYIDSILNVLKTSNICPESCVLRSTIVSWDSRVNEKLEIDLIEKKNYNK